MCYLEDDILEEIEAQREVDRRRRTDEADGYFAQEEDGDAY